ncbi:MAG: hypothetical protein ACTSWA_10035, partial [Candidatus Thorarchaeota archaeon]
MDFQLDVLLDDPNILSFENKLIGQLTENEQLRNHIYIFAEYFMEEELWEYDLDGSDKRSINSRLSKKVKGKKIYSFDDFVKLGLLYKLPWVKVDYYAGEETKYIVPNHTFTVLDELYMDPNLEEPYTCRFCDTAFATEDVLKKHENVCSENLDAPEKYESSVQPKDTGLISTHEILPESNTFLIERGAGVRVGMSLLDEIVQSAS